MRPLDAANDAADILHKQLERLGLDIHVLGGVAVRTGQPPTSEPCVTIQGAITPARALRFVQTLSTLPTEPEPPTPAP